MNPLPKLRKMALALPAAHEVEAWGAPTFRVRNKLYAMYSGLSNHHGGHRVSVWIKAAPGEQALMVSTAPDRYFVPPYVGAGGWVGVWLDDGVDWDLVRTLLEDGHRLVAPKRLLAGSTPLTGVHVATKKSAKKAVKKAAKKVAKKASSKAKSTAKKAKSSAKKAVGKAKAGAKKAAKRAGAAVKSAAKKVAKKAKSPRGKKVAKVAAAVAAVAAIGAAIAKGRK